jgi:hypothetical protein
MVQLLLKSIFAVPCGHGIKPKVDILKDAGGIESFRMDEESERGFLSGPAVRGSSIGLAASLCVTRFQQKDRETGACRNLNRCPMIGGAHVRHLQRFDDNRFAAVR